MLIAGVAVVLAVAALLAVRLVALAAMEPSAGRGAYHDSPFQMPGRYVDPREEEGSTADEHTPPRDPVEASVRGRLPAPLFVPAPLRAPIVPPINQALPEPGAPPPHERHH